MSLGHFHSSLLLLLSLVVITINTSSSAQAPAKAPSPAAVTALPPSLPPPLPPSPSKARKHDIIQILEKEGDFSVLLRLMRSTHVADQINSQLNDLNDGLTVFAPTDDAFSALKPGALNAMSDEQQVELMQFHVVPTLLSMTQFQTVSNPLMTKAGGNNPGEFPLNVTSNGDRVSLYTDSTEASIERTLFTDNRLAVYQVIHHYQLTDLDSLVKRREL